MGTIASQITSLTIVHSTVNSDADQRKHRSYASLAFVRGIHHWPVNSPHKWPVTRKIFPFDDVIVIGFHFELCWFYIDVIMSAIASQITSLTIVCSAVCSGADQRKHQSSASLGFVRGIHQWPVTSPHKGPVIQKMLPFDDVIMWDPFYKYIRDHDPNLVHVWVAITEKNMRLGHNLVHVTTYQLLYVKIVVCEMGPSTEIVEILRTSLWNAFV